ncbi:OmpA family protein [Polycyclovorans algicola]|uniref:OmpA family protein n=1 Tax=Polycyclovorans algicola TaxID=616992 RepID=UPI000693A9DA|nr:OmpA family protein [Polycyclovorans algicola]
MMSTLRSSALGALAIAALAASAGASAQVSPGWYASVGAYSSEINDANGTTTPTVITLAPDVITPGQACLLGPVTGAIPGLGGALEGLGGALAGDTGCLLGLLGPGADDEIQPGQQVESRGQSQPIGVIFDGGFGINTAIGYQFIGGLRPEITLGLSTNDFNVITGSAELADQRNNVGGKLEATRVGANLWFDIPVGERVLPYLGAGLGFQSAKTTFDSTGSDTDTGNFFQAGAGLGYLLNPRTVISLDYRYLVSSDIESSSFIPATTEPDPATGGAIGTRLDDRYEHEAHHIGLSLRYVYSVAKVADADGDGVADFLDRCPNSPAEVQVDRFGCPLDSDGDGIADHLDKCPNTAPGVQVDDKGCPLDSDGDGVPDHLDQCPNTPEDTQVDKRGCPLDLRDSDGDGVPDLFDKCPDTPADAPTDEDGCPIDSDGDGIADYLDECPNTPPGLAVLPDGCALEGDCRRPRPGEAVDERGCAVDRNFILRGVKFEFDSAILTTEAKQILDRVSETLRAYPNVKVELGGHTDSIGSASYNLGLSERRSIAVKEYLISKRVPGERMTPVGYGVSRPIADNATESGREENRRVELSVRD